MGGDARVVPGPPVVGCLTSTECVGMVSPALPVTSVLAALTTPSLAMRRIWSAGTGGGWRQRSCCSRQFDI